MRNPVQDRSIEYNDNRISKYTAQLGKCAVTGTILSCEEIHCHHIKPRADGGTDKFQNLIRRSEEHTSELQSRGHLVCRLLLEKKKRSGASVRGHANGASSAQREQ